MSVKSFKQKMKEEMNVLQDERKVLIREERAVIEEIRALYEEVQGATTTPESAEANTATHAPAAKPPVDEQSVDAEGGAVAAEEQAEADMESTEAEAQDEPAGTQGEAEANTQTEAEQTAEEGVIEEAVETQTEAQDEPAETEVDSNIDIDGDGLDLDDLFAQEQDMQGSTEDDDVTMPEPGEDDVDEILNDIDDDWDDEAGIDDSFFDALESELSSDDEEDEMGIEDLDALLQVD